MNYAFKFFLLSILILLSSNSSYAVTKIWCVGNHYGHLSKHPLPGAKGFNSCPGKSFNKVSFDEVIKHYSSGEGKNHLCNMLYGSDFNNPRLKVWFELAVEIKVKCKENSINDTKIVIKEDKESKKLAEKERQKRIELEKKLAALEKKSETKDYIPSKLQSWNKLDEQEPLRCYDTINKKVYIIPAEGVGTQGRHQSTAKCMGNAFRISKNDYEKLAPKQNVYENDKVICYKATDGWSGKWSITNQKYVKKAIQLGLSCGIKTNPTIIAEENIKKDKSINSEELEKEQQKRIELEEKLAILSKKNNVNVDKLVKDTTAPVISAQSKRNGFYANISGTITDDVKLAEVLIDNKLITPESDGSFNTKLYVPRDGLEVKILAFDMKGNKSIKTLQVERGAIEEASGPIFASLDPSAKKVKSNPNALALIVGVANYSKTNADAIYADKDAQQFYDYARMKLGIPAKNIKELLNDKAEYAEIILTTKNWLRRTSKANKSDIYIYFAGHGLASDDGKDMYLLPYDGRPGLLDKTALLRDELFTNIQQANPRGVTVFLDTCYSGTTRGTDMLIASRPIAIRALEQSIPNNFTVFSAAAGDQTSKPLEEAKHGMFSYFLMKGMEGDADANNDNKITARELHAYVEQNVVQQSSGSQTPELQGDKDRVLVQFN